jgi:hypothetical protein
MIKSKVTVFVILTLWLTGFSVPALAVKWKDISAEESDVKLINPPGSAACLIRTANADDYSRKYTVFFCPRYAYGEPQTYIRVQMLYPNFYWEGGYRADFKDHPMFTKWKSSTAAAYKNPTIHPGQKTKCYNDSECAFRRITFSLKERDCQWVNYSPNLKSGSRGGGSPFALEIFTCHTTTPITEDRIEISNKSVVIKFPETSSSLEASSDKEVCEKATVYNGSWDTDDKYKNYVEEAKKRGLTLSRCAALTGREDPIAKAKAEAEAKAAADAKRKAEAEAKAAAEAKAKAEAEAKANPPLGDLRDKSYAQNLLDDVRAFVALNPTVLDPIILGRFYTPAVNEVKSEAFKNNGSSFLQLAEFVKANDAFSAHHKTEMEKRFAAIEAKRQSLYASLLQSLADVKAKIAADPLAPIAPKLIEIFGRYETIKSDASVDVLEQSVAGLRSESSKVGMVVASSEAKAKEADPAPKPIKKSAANLKQLSDIGSEDAVLLANLAGDAPNAFRDLNGKPAFEKKQVKLCAPALGSLKRKHRAFVRNTVSKALPGHTIQMVSECSSYKGYDGVLATGANFAKGDGLPSADQTANRLKGNKLVRMTVIEVKDFNRELAKRDILSSQYKADIEQGARNGYGAISYDNESEVACIADIKDTTAHDRALQQAADARQFDEAVASKSSVSVTATEAFKQAQRDNCGLIYGSASTLKTLLQASATAGLSGDVLPVWITPGAIEQRAKQIAAGEKDSQEAEGARRAELQKQQAEAIAKLKAEAQQLETRQRQYRAQHGAKVASLVSVIDQQLGDVRSGIDKALSASSGVKAAVDSQNFWAPYPAWYADQRKKGWVFESTVPAPKDYGFAKWKGRQIETVIAEIKVLMKNPDLGEYAETCWIAGYINDSEFKRYREPFISECKNSAELDAWRGQHSFNTQWDLGVK